MLGAETSWSETSGSETSRSKKSRGETSWIRNVQVHNVQGERGGSVVECGTPEREVGGSKPTAAVLCPWARHFTPESTG